MIQRGMSSITSSRRILMLAPTSTLVRDRRIVLTCNSLAKDGYEVHVVAPRQTEGQDRLDRLFSPGVFLHPIPDHYESTMYRFTLETPELPGIASWPWRLCMRGLRKITDHWFDNRWLEAFARRLRVFYWNTGTKWIYHSGHADDFYFLCQLGPWNFWRHRNSLKLNHQSLWYWVRANEVLKSHPAQIVYCHDLWSLPIGCLLKKLTRGRLVFDSHDIGTSVIEDTQAKALALKCERWLYSQVDRFLTVNESLVEFYKKLYPELCPQVLFNAAAAWTGSPLKPGLRERFGIEVHRPLAVLVGTLNHDQGVTHFLASMKQVKSRLALVIMGDGARKAEFENKAREWGLLGKDVFFTGVVSFMDVVPLAAGATFGIIPCIQKNVNYGMNSSAKLYDYIQASLPVISDEGIEIEKVFRRFPIGRTIDLSKTPEQTAQDLDRFVEDLPSFQGALLAAKQYYVWPENFAGQVLASLT